MDEIDGLLIGGLGRELWFTSSRFSYESSSQPFNESGVFSIRNLFLFGLTLLKNPFVYFIKMRFGVLEGLLWTGRPRSVALR